MYVIREMQTAADGTVAHLPPVNEQDIFKAESVFYQKAASAAISSVPVHTVLLETDEGVQILKKSFAHGVIHPSCYVIFEVQTSSGIPAHLPPANDPDRLSAESVYYTKLSYAAVSKISKHTVILETNDGKLLMRQCYKHEQQVVEAEDHTADEPEEYEDG